MAEISTNLYNQLRTILLKCGPFSDFAQLKALFVDKRISAWRDNLPDAKEMATRVNLVIDYLVEQNNAEHENALVLFLRVLCDQKKVSDACYQQLLELAHDLENELLVSNKPQLNLNSISTPILRKQKFNWLCLIGAFCCFLVGIWIGTALPQSIGIEDNPSNTATIDDLASATKTMVVPPYSPKPTATSTSSEVLFYEDFESEATPEWGHFENALPVDGKLEVQNGSVATEPIGDQDWTNYAVTLTMTHYGTDEWRVFIRAKDENNYMEFLCRGSSYLCFWYVVVDGVRQPPSTFYTLEHSKPFQIRLEARKNRYLVFFNGQEQEEYLINDEFDAGYFAFLTSESATLSIESIEVIRLP